MDNTPHIRLALSDRSYVSIVKKEIHRIAKQVSFNNQRLAEIDIVIAEITSNLIKHSKEGEILVKEIKRKETSGIEIISIDRGPGIADVNFMLKDGISTTKTLGQGLGAIRRLSDNFDIYSIAGWGTVLLSRIFVAPEKLKHEAINVSAVMTAKKNEEFCGDGYQYVGNTSAYNILALDGLGHGKEANKATEEANKIFSVSYKETPSELIKTMHRGIRSTRGAVGMAFNISLKNKTLLYCGVGNISARLIGEEKIKSLISYNGIIGHILPNSLNNNSIEWNTSDYLIICSDGIKAKWDLQKFPNLLKYDGSVIASVLFRDQLRDTDDALIIVVSNNKIKKTTASPSE